QALTRVVHPPAATQTPTQSHGPTTCHCSGPLQAGWRYCPSCARPVGGRCPNCNEPLLPQWKRCPYC
ncbi:zinc ribbon domain-containing protein, partial [Acidimicrobium ferrooxidans]|nr:zinc ribbon domain-containing protein [Acidimicrobium ferrooxidans]